MRIAGISALSIKSLMLALALLAFLPTTPIIHDDEVLIPDKLELYANGRIRYESTFDQTNGEDRHRGRIRFRIGGKYKLDDKLNVHARVSTSSDGVDANSPYLDFGDSGDGFEGAELLLDRFYVEWFTNDWITLQAGKLPHVFTTPPVSGEILWDDDIQPAGFTAKFSCTEANKKYDLRLLKYTAVESGSDDDPSMVGAQFNATCDVQDDLSVHFATAITHWSNLNPGSGSFQNQGNVLNGAGDFASDFAVWDSFIDVTHQGGPFGRQQGFVMFWDNMKESGQRGYACGARVGNHQAPGDYSLFGFWFQADADSLFSPVSQDDLPLAGTGAGSGVQGIGYGSDYRINEDVTLRLWALGSRSETTDNPFRVRLDLNFNI
ncbi:MAG: hypothetical protein ACI8TQ_003595 [Planctomycetota bacterium]